MLFETFDEIVAEYAEGASRREVEQARRTFFDRSGKVSDDEPRFEERITAFLEWYALARPLDDARIEPLGRAALRRLARVEAARPDRLRVVVLSGRTALDVAGRVRVGGIGYPGNHGLQGGVLPRGPRAERPLVPGAPELDRFGAPVRALGLAVPAAPRTTACFQTSRCSSVSKRPMPASADDSSSEPSPAEVMATMLVRSASFQSTLQLPIARS